MKKVLIVILCILILLGILFVGAEWYLNAKGSKILKDELAKATDNTCNIVIGKTTVNLLHRSVTLKNISLEGENITINGEKSPFKSLKISAKSLTLTGIRYKNHKKDSTRSVFCKLLGLDSPSIIAYMSSEAEEKSTPEEKTE